MLSSSIKLNSLVPVDGECLEKLRSLSDGLRMLNDDSNRSRTRPVSNLDPVSADA